MRTTKLLLALLTTSLVFTSVAPVAATYASDKKVHKYTICHATSSTKNPYVKVTVDYNSIVKMGHDQHQDHGDIIPAIPEHNYAGLNSDKLDVLENDCKLVDTIVHPELPVAPEQPVTPTKPEQPAKPKNKPATKEHKYTICHATSSAKNPYVKITVDYNSIIKRGHDQHQDHGDIIPAIPEHNYAGLNTDKLHILENDCKPVTASEVTPTDPVTPGQGGVTPIEDPVIEILDAASTDAPAVASAATTLPQTGTAYTTLLGFAASVIAAGLTYGAQAVRRIFVKA